MFERCQVHSSQRSAAPSSARKCALPYVRIPLSPEVMVCARVFCGCGVTGDVASLSFAHVTYFAGWWDAEVGVGGLVGWKGVSQQ